MTASRVALATALAVIAIARPARADDGDHRGLHGGIVLGGAAAYALSELVFKDALAPDACRWCDDNPVDRGARDALRWSSPRTAGRLSDATAYAIAPALELGLLFVAGRGERDAVGDDAWIDDGLAVTEAVVVAVLANQAVKMAVGRQRPYAHAATPARPSSDDDLSFYSGHTTLVFTFAAAAGTVAQMRGYDEAPWIWASGVALGAGAGYLRMAADKHWLSDVAVGAVIGTGIGIAVPRLAHRHLERGSGESMTLGVAARFASVSGTF